MRKLILISAAAVWAVLFSHFASGQQRISVGFYNVENLMDTIPSMFYDDSDYTPNGRYGWNTERYNKKLADIARVIDDMGLDVVGLAEVENEGVVRDLVMSLDDDYNYIHHTSGDRRGIDLAMIYKGDKFFPERSVLISSGAPREFLHVKGMLAGEKMNIVICHLPSKANDRAYRERIMGRLAFVSDSLCRAEPDRKLIVMGDFNCDPREKLFKRAFGKKSSGINGKGAGGFYDKSMMYGAVGSPDGTGSYAYDGKWFLFDNILLSFPLVRGEGLRYESGGVFVREYMLTGGADNVSARRKGYPYRTTASGNYTGGYSDHLPVYVVLTR